MKASVIIATYGRDSCLADTIRSVLRQDYPDFELLVVDQSPDHTPEVGIFLRNVDDPRYSYHLITPPSLPAARNFGLTRAGGEIVIYIDDDVLLDPGFIHAHVTAYERAERITAVGGRVRTRNRPASTHLQAFSADGSWSGGFDFPNEGELETALGCNMSFRRSALEAIDGFDPSYEGNALWEECDVCFRLRHQGHRIRFEPRAALNHLVAPTGGCRSREKEIWENSSSFQNEVLFHIKNLGFWLFFLFFFKVFKNHVWPHKRSLKFWTRLKAFSTGMPRGIWLAFFPKKLQPGVIWELNRTGDIGDVQKLISKAPTKFKTLSPRPGDAPCRVALLGCGAVSELYHAPALQHLEAEGEVEVTAVFDPDAGRAARLCAQFPGAISYPDESFLQKVPLDLAIVASPVSFHEAQCLRALEAGIAVLCEKPLAANTASGDRMIAAALKHRRILAVGLLRRFYANVQFVRQVIQGKTLGAVTSFSIQEGGPFNWPAKSDSFFRKNTAGGGVLLDLGVHVLDLVVHWFGEPQELTYADDAMGGLEANCRMEFSYSAGCKGTVHLSHDWNTPDLYVIEFERGTLKLHAGEAEQVELQLKNSSFLLEGPLKDRAGLDSSANAVASASTFQQAFLVQLRDLISAVRTAGCPAIPAEEGIRSLRLTERCYQNRTLMDMPWLEPEEQNSIQLLAARGTR